MKKIKFLFGTFALIFAITLIGCGGPETPPPTPPNGDPNDEPEEDPRVEETIPIPQDSGTEGDVFMFITNKGDSWVEYKNFNDVIQNSPSRSALPEHSDIPNNALGDNYSHYTCGLGIEAVRKSYDMSFLNDTASRTATSSGNTKDVNKKAANVGDESDFWIWIEDDNGKDAQKKIHATCQFVDGACQIFVEDGWFDGTYPGEEVFSGSSYKTAKITTPGVEKLAEKFNSIYEVEQALLGKASLDGFNYNNIIETPEKITILVSAIGYTEWKDKDTQEVLGLGGTFGYFYGTDFRCDCDANGAIKFSDGTYYTNQRMMITLNVTGFYKDSSEKHIELGGEDEMYSTLGHEFNHMLNQVNKGLNNIRYSSWFTEMLSAIAEDFTPDYLGIPNTVQKMRLPVFFRGTHEGMIDWYGTDSVDYSYGFAYAFGTYLIRNYGGVKFLHELATNQYGDKQAVTEAMKACGFTETYDSALLKFAQALVNTSKEKPTFKREETGSYELNGTTYNFTFPAVDLYNFNFGYITEEDLNTYYDNPYWTKYDSETIDGKTYKLVYGPRFLKLNYYYSLYGNSFMVQYLGKTTEWPDGVKLLYPRDENIVVEIFVQFVQ